MILCDNPLGYWRLGEPTGTALAKDEMGAASGNAMNVQSVPGALKNDSNKAAGFPEDVAAKVTVPDVVGTFAFTAMAEFSIEVWVRVPAGATTPGDDRNIVARYSGANGYELFFPNDAGTVRLKRGSADPWDSTTSQVSVNDGQWHHVVAVYDGSQLLFYVDAAPQGAMAATQAIASMQEDLVIGPEYATTSTTFVREIDEVAIYAKTLDGSQVLRHFCMGSVGQPSC